MKKKLLTLMIALLAIPQQSHTINSKEAVGLFALYVIIGLALYKKLSSSYTIITLFGEKETKNVTLTSDITSIIANRFGNVVIVENPLAKNNLEITANSAVMPSIQHTVRGDTFTLGLEKNTDIVGRTTINYVITLQKINKIKANGVIKISTKTELENIQKIRANDASELTATINANQITINQSDSSNVTVSGSVNTQIIKLSESSCYNARKLTSNDLICTASGSAKATMQTNTTSDDNSVQIELSDSSNATVGGSVNTQIVKLSESSCYNAPNLTSNNLICYASGSAQATMCNIGTSDDNSVQIEQSDSSCIHLSGITKKHIATLKGSSYYNAKKLHSNTIILTLEGAPQAHINTPRTRVTCYSSGRPSIKNYHVTKWYNEKTHSHLVRMLILQC